LPATHARKLALNFCGFTLQPLNLTTRRERVGDEPELVTVREDDWVIRCEQVELGADRLDAAVSSSISHG
jgi:hypothetical protein